MIERLLKGAIKMWSKQERMKAVMSGEPADRPPVTAYRHFPGCEEDPVLSAKAMVEFQRKYDWDWVKVNPSAVYYYEPWGNKYDYAHYQGTVPTRLDYGIHTVEDLEKVVPHSGLYGSFGTQVHALRLIREALGPDCPIYQSIFTPIAILLNICGGRSPGRYREAPRDACPLLPLFREHKELVHRALKNITETLADYAAQCLKNGADGMFFAEMGLAREGYLTLEEWKEFIEPYDRAILEVIAPHPCALHTCGIYGNPERFVEYHYPITALHWAESAPGNPPIAGSEKWLNGIAAMGGVDERLFGTRAVEKIRTMAANSVAANKNRPFLLAPECTVAASTTEEEYMALKSASHD